MTKNIFSILKNILKKQEKYSCIIFDGLTMRYQNMTKEEIELFKNKDEHKNWTLTINEKIE